MSLFRANRVRLLDLTKGSLESLRYVTRAAVYTNAKSR